MSWPKRQTYYKIAIVCLFILAIAAFLKFELYRFLTLQSLKVYQDMLSAFYSEYPVIAVTLYVAAYIAMAAISLPAIIVMSLVAGAIFGHVTGTITASFASSIGGTLAFLSARYLFRDYVQNQFRFSLRMINSEIEREGWLYLLTLRLVPVLPYFLVNLAMALTPIKTRTFYIVTQIAMLPGTIVYVNAGTQLASIESVDDIFSIPLIASFAVLAAFPWIAKGFAFAVRTIFYRKKKIDPPPGR